MQRPATPILDAWRFVAILTWALGLQVHEAVANVGQVAFALSYLPELPRLNRKMLFAWWPVLAFILWALVAPTVAGRPPDANGTVRILDWLMVPLLADAASALTARRWRVLGWTTFVTLIVSSGVAGLQHFGRWPPEEAFESLRWTNAAFERVYERIPASDRFMGGGLLFHRLKFSHISGLVLVGTVVGARWFTGTLRWVAVASGVVGLVAVWMFPHARMGAVAATVGVLVAVVAVSRTRKRALFVCAVVVAFSAAAVVLNPTMRARFRAATTAGGSGDRTHLIRSGISAVREAPIAGVGPGRFAPRHFSHEGMPLHVARNPGKAHNQFVSTAAETGLVGGVLFVVMLVWLGLVARRRQLGALTLGGLAFFASLSLVHDPLYQTAVSLGVVLLLGLGLGRERSTAPV